MSAKVSRIENEALAVLSAGRCDGPRYFLPSGQLDRKLYTRTNEVLEALGGKWNRGAKAHVFGEDCSDVIEAAIETGTFTRPSDMGWFPTPPALAKKVVDYAEVRRNASVLEPSAGEGAIALAAQADGGVVDCYEIDRGRFDKLTALGFATVLGDFLLAEPIPRYDCVTMNPPFAKRADIAHVLHARKFLRPGGLLVAIMSGGIVFREDRLTQDFRAECETIESLPEGSFSASGTEVNTAIVTMRA